MAFVFYGSSVRVQKDEEKQEEKYKETKPIFEVAYLWNVLCNFAEIWNVEY